MLQNPAPAEELANVGTQPNHTAALATQQGRVYDALSQGTLGQGLEHTYLCQDTPVRD